MNIDIKRIINSKRGKIVFSILLGLGLATLFRQSCNSNKCLVFKAPPLDEIKNKIFNYNNKCYKFTEKSVTCDKPDQVLINIHTSN